MIKSLFLILFLSTTINSKNLRINHLRKLNKECPPSDYLEKMFCFQCEQTSGGTGCTMGGICGKNSNLSNLQDSLTGALITLATQNKHTKENDYLIIRVLFATLSNVNFNEESIKSLIDEVHKSSGNTNDFCMTDIWNSEEDIRSLKSLILFGLRGMAAYAYHAYALGFQDEEVNSFFYEALNALNDKDYTLNDLFSFTMQLGEINYKCMKLLDKANTETYGNPMPVDVSLAIENGPFIVVTGHDLLDLKLLLEQTKEKGINIYTHGEMLPAHGYPELRNYPHLKGHFGTAWHNQQKEFDGIPAPILFTTNCLMPPRQSYSDRIYTTNVVSYPNAIHIDDKKDFTPIITKALELGGYTDKNPIKDIIEGKKMTTGYGRKTILSDINTIVEAVKSGKIKHFFVVAGCDGNKEERSYYTEFVKNTPKDSIILTAACGKFKFNDLDLGKIGNFPRIIDMGQCNDSYGIVELAIALAGAFGVGVNDLPLSIVLSWYEQKAVSVLLSLLSLGVKNILIGPSLPAFISPNVLKILIDTFNIGSISDPIKDLEKLLSK